MAQSSPAGLVTRRYLVSGRVQGVFFRASTRDRAQALGMSGHALNLSDGRVEVLARGTETAQRSLEAWLHDGPPAARVSAVHVEPSDEPVGNGFRTG